MGRSRRGPVRYAIVGLGHIAQAAMLPAFAHAKRNSRLVALVSDDAIRRAQEALWSAVRIVAEPGGAAAFAALLAGAYVPRSGERVGVVISGGNSTAVDFGST